MPNTKRQTEMHFMLHNKNAFNSVLVSSDQNKPYRQWDNRSEVRSSKPSMISEDSWIAVGFSRHCTARKCDQRLRRADQSGIDWLKTSISLIFDILFPQTLAFALREGYYCSEIHSYFICHIQALTKSDRSQRMLFSMRFLRSVIAMVSCVLSLTSRTSA